MPAPDIFGFPIAGVSGSRGQVWLPEGKAVNLLGLSIQSSKP
jgi:hypothetical protein